MLVAAEAETVPHVLVSLALFVGSFSEHFPSSRHTRSAQLSTMKSLTRVSSEIRFLASDTQEMCVE
jgi:hypothetical protein